MHRQKRNQTVKRRNADVLRAARNAALSEVGEWVEDPRFLMAAIDKQTTRLRFAVKMGIRPSVRAEVRTSALLLAMLDDCYRVKSG